MRVLSNLSRLAGGLALVAACVAAQAQGFPSKPVSLVVPYAPGGATDTLARVVAEKLSARLGQPVLVENKPGANTMIATNYVRQAAPDGHTLLMASPAFGQLPVVNPSLAKYDAVKDFTSIAQTSGLLNVLVVNPNLPIKNVRELIDYAKANPGKVSVATTGVGAQDHLAGELFAYRNGLKLIFVPYKGGAPAIQDVVAGVAHARFDAMPSSRQFIETGRLRALAVMDPKRHPNFPNIPSISETGAGMDYGGYFGIVGPKGMPQAVVTRLSNEIAAVVKMPDVAEKLGQLGMDAVAGSPADFAGVMEADARKWAKLIADTGLKIEQ